MKNNKLYQKAYDEVRSKAQYMVGSQKAYRALSTKAKHDLREASKKLLLLSEADNYLKQYHDSRSKFSSGYVYLMENKAWQGWIKIGRAANVRARLRNYQTSSPHRDFEVVMKAPCTNTQKSEAALLNTIRKYGKDFKGEWVKIPKSQAKRLFKQVVSTHA